MANRPDFPPDVPLSPADLAELRHRYAQLSTSGLQTVYAEVWERCESKPPGRPFGATILSQSLAIRSCDDTLVYAKQWILNNPSSGRASAATSP
jgi:hypothetical protein